MITTNSNTLAAPVAQFDPATGTYLIRSSRGPGHGAYRVDLETEECTCPHFEHRLKGRDTGLVCKHIAACRVQVWEGQQVAA